MTEHIQHPEHDGPDFGTIQVKPDNALADESSAQHRPTLRRKKTGSRKGSEAPGRRKKSSLRRGMGFYLPFFLLAVLLTLGALLFFLPQYVKERLIQDLSQHLGRPVQIGEFSLSPFKGKLYLRDIVLGADPLRPKDPSLGTIASIKAGIQIQALVKGHWLVHDVEMKGLDATVQRYADGSYTRLTARASGFTPLPQWLTVQGVQLSASKVQFLDQVNGREHQIQDIEFSLPHTKPLQPSLRAVLDSSPVFIQGQQHTGRSGPETRLTLHLEDIELQHYLAWIPTIGNTVQMQADRSDAVVEIIFHTGKGPEILANLQSKALRVQALAETFTLHLPQAQARIRVQPWEQSYFIEELTLDEAQLDLHQDSKPLSASALLELFHPKDVNLSIDRLNLNKGRIRTKAEVWEDIQVNLSDFQNTAAKAPAPLFVSARQDTSEFTFTGEVEKNAALTGILNLRNMKAHFVMPFVSADTAFRLSQGSVDINAQLHIEQRKTRLTGAAVVLHKMHLQRNKDTLLSVQRLEGRDCTLENTPPLLHCERIALEQAEFPEKTIDFFREGKGFAISTRRLEIQQGSTQIQLAQGIQVPLTNLNFSLREAEAKGHNLNFTAKLGSRGHFSGQGLYHRNGSGTVDFTAQDVDIKLFPIKFITVNQGSLDIKGRYVLADKRFHGAFQLKDFAGENSQGEKIRWKEAGASTVEARLEPFTLSMAQLSLQQPTVQLTSLEKSPWAALPFSLLQKQQHPILSIEQLQVIGANLEEQGSKTKFNQLGGELGPLHSGGLAQIQLAGKMNGKDFSLRGTLNEGGLTLTEQTGALAPPKIFPEPPVKGTPEPVQVVVEEKQEEESPQPVEQAEVPEPMEEHIPDKVTRDPVQAVIEEEQPVEQAEVPEPVEEHIPDKGVPEPVQVLVEEKQPVEEHIPDKVTIDPVQAVIEEEQEEESPYSAEQVEVPEPIEEDELDQYFHPAEQTEPVEERIPEEIPVQAPVQEVIEEDELDQYFHPAEQTEPVEERIPEEIIVQAPVQEMIEEDELDQYFHPAEQTEPVEERISEEIPVQAPVQEVIEEDELDQYFHPAEQDDFVGIPYFLEIPIEAETLPEPVAAYFPLDKVAADLARLVNADPGRAAVEWNEQGEKNIVELHDFIPALGSDFALVLALLTDETGTARLTLSPAPLSVDQLGEAISERLQRLRRQAVVAPEQILPQLATLPRRVDFMPGDMIPDFMRNLEGFAPLLKQRPNVGLEVRGCYDREIDLEPLLARLYDANAMDFPDDALLNLAQDRAAHIQYFLVENLGLPAERILLHEGSACGHQVDLRPFASW